MENNVYSAPNSDLETEESGREYETASRSRRFFNMLVDTISYYVFAFLVGIVAYALGLDQQLNQVNDYILGFFILILYYVPQEALWGRTIGKLVTGTRCVSMDGGKVSFGQVLGRTLMRLVPFEALSFLFASEPVRGWHDRAPNTQVVMVR